MIVEMGYFKMKATQVAIHGRTEEGRREMNI